MGFTAGFLGSVALTSSILYLTISLHRQNRQQQALMLRQQSLILKSIMEPSTLEAPSTAREARVSVVDTVKDRWNGEIEGLVRKAQNTDWDAVRDRMESRISTMWSKAFEKAREVESKS